MSPPPADDNELYFISSDMDKTTGAGYQKLPQGDADKDDEVMDVTKLEKDKNWKKSLVKLVEVVWEWLCWTESDG